MGGRGAYSGKTNILLYKDYHTVLLIGRMRVIEPNPPKKSRSTPTLSRTPRAIYATLTKEGKPKQITVYNKNREKLYDIDLDHDHSKGKYPDGHVQYYKNGQRQEDYSPLNHRQRKLVQQLTAGLLEAGYGR